jgi:hypothetical protein
LAQNVIDVVGLSEYGEIGSRIHNSKFRRDYCFICGEPIRVSLNMIGKPNSCSFCQPAYRSSPGITEVERMFWIEESLFEVDIIEQKSPETN